MRNFSLPLSSPFPVVDHQRKRRLSVNLLDRKGRGCHEHQAPVGTRVFPVSTSAFGDEIKIREQCADNLMYTRKGSTRDSFSGWTE
ncbi:MAG: hypothetical protein ACP5CD_02585 [Thermovirgaceae bacterium]